MKDPDLSRYQNQCSKFMNVTAINKLFYPTLIDYGKWWYKT